MCLPTNSIILIFASLITLFLSWISASAFAKVRRFLRIGISLFDITPTSKKIKKHVADKPQTLHESTCHIGKLSSKDRQS